LLSAEGDDWAPIVSGGSEEVVGQVHLAQGSGWRQRYLAAHFTHLPVYVPISVKLVPVAHDHLHKNNENQSSNQ